MRAIDVSVQPWDASLAEWADEVAFSVPMHTATRLASDLPRDQQPSAAFGLYAQQCTRLRDPRRLGWQPHVHETSRTLLPARSTEYARLVDRWRSNGCVGSVSPPVDVHTGAGTVRCPWSSTDACSASTRPGRSTTSHSSSPRARSLSFGDPDSSTRHRTRAASSARCTSDSLDLTFDCTVKVEHVFRHADVWSEFAEVGLRVRGDGVRVGERRGARTTRQGPRHRRRRRRDRAPSRLMASTYGRRGCRSPRGPRATTSSRCSTSSTNTTSSAASIRCNTPCACSSPRARCCSGIPTCSRTSAPGTTSGRRTRGPTRIRRWTTCSFARRLVEDGTVDEPHVAVYGRCATPSARPRRPLPGTTGRPRLSESWFCCAEPTAVQLRASAPRWSGGAVISWCNLKSAVWTVPSASSRLNVRH